MELLSSDIKASLQPGTTEEEQHHTSSQRIDCCLSKINQAIKTVEQLLFSDNEYNQNTHQALVECNGNSDITAEDKVKLLTAQVESLKEQLILKESELQATQQELKHTNQDLIAALKPDMLTLGDAKELAKKIFEKNSISEYAAKLLSGIYNSTVEASELAPTNEYNNKENTMNAQLNKLTSIRQTLKEESSALKYESLNLKNRVAELKAKSQNIIARTAKLKKK
ncbi:hypothetical protein NIES2101_29465 [Calothrix sp. HK-06]|nr:hypothetical protein NIES2101_29465 [Calothrix sp. HK-06]